MPSLELEDFLLSGLYDLRVLYVKQPAGGGRVTTRTSKRRTTKDRARLHFAGRG